MTSTRGRRRQVATQHQFCPNPRCRYYGWVGRGNLRANGHPGGGPWRQLSCMACGVYFLETHGTPVHGKRVPAELLVRVVAALAEGLCIRAVARVFEVDPNTVLQWLVEAADQLEVFSRYFLRDVHVSQIQLDELFAMLREVKAGEISAAEAIKQLSRVPYWVWVAIDPVSKLLLTINVGKRTLVIAQRLVHQVAQVVTPGCVPLFLTDGLKEYITLAGVNQALASQGWHINTAFVERVNLTIRHHVAAVGRRVITLCKSAEGLHHQLALYRTYDNFCLPHASLRQPLPQSLPTHGTGSTKQWRPATPAMAARLTDRVWTLREVLRFRVPPWPQPQDL